MLGDDLRVALGMAIEHAREKRHEFLTLEHLLHALLHEPRVSEVLEACGADLYLDQQSIDTTTRAGNLMFRLRARFPSLSAA